MHVRFTSIRGMTVVDDSTQQIVAALDEPLIHPDSGKIVGFFCTALAAFDSADLFLLALDIVTWGLHVHVRSADRLCPPGELVRIQEILEDPRTFLAQEIRIEQTKKYIGRLRDVQFDTRHFLVEWVFPKKWFFWKQPIPSTDIVEITEEAVWVRNPLRDVKEKELLEEKKVEAPTLKEVVPTPAVD